MTTLPTDPTDPRPDANVATGPAPAQPRQADLDPELQPELPAGIVAGADPQGAWPQRVNPLISAAQPLLLAAGILPRAAPPQSVAQLQQTLTELMDQFSSSVDHGQPSLRDSAQYALCALLDELIVSTNWGGQQWPQYSLLSKYYSQDFAGEEFFQRLEKAGKQREGNTWLLEFYHLCLSLGYSGRFHQRRQTDAGIQKLRDQLGALIRQLRSHAGMPLSPPLPSQKTSRIPQLPLWVLASLAAAFTIGIHQAMSWYLARYSEPLLQAIQAIGR